MRVIVRWPAPQFSLFTDEAADSVTGRTVPVTAELPGNAWAGRTHVGIAKVLNAKVIEHGLAMEVELDVRERR